MRFHAEKASSPGESSVSMQRPASSIELGKMAIFAENGANMEIDLTIEQTRPA